MSWLRRELPFFLELLALTGLAVTQPVLDTFQRSADVFVLRGAGAADTVVFGLVIAFAPAVCLWAIGALGGLGCDRRRRWLHLLLLAGVAGVLAVVLLKKATDWGRSELVVAGVAAGLLLGVLVWRLAAARLWLRYLSVAPVLFLVLFLAASPVSSVAFAGGTGDLRPVEVGNPAPVVMVVFDELPTASLLDGRGGIDRTLFPNFATLAHDATWYRNHSTVAPDTPVAVPAILTGSYPESQDDVPVAADYPDNLFTLLAGTYELNVFELGTDLCPPDVCLDPEGTSGGSALGSLLGDAVDVWADLASPAPTEQAGFTVRQTEARAAVRFRRFVDSLSDDPGARLDFLHIISPHQPWRTLPSGVRFESPTLPEGLDDGYRWRTDFAAVSARSRHLLQTQFADRLLGELVDRMRDLGTYDESMIIVTADHGVAFTRGSPVRGASEANFAEIMWTPLLVKAPGAPAGEGRLDDTPVQSIDILPTITETLGVEAPFPVDGVPAGSRSGRSDERRLMDWARNAVEPDDGTYHVFSGRAGFAQLLERGPAGDPRDDSGLRLYRLPPHGDLVGRAVEDATVTDGADRVRGWLHEPGDYRDVDLDGEVLPLYAAGEIDQSEPIDVAVAVNGVIAGWCRTLKAEDAARREFWVVIPPQLLRDGENDIDLYVLTGPPGDPTLAPIAIAGGEG